jgi:hypothetical protein
VNKKSNRALHFPRKRKKDVVGATSAENMPLPPDPRQDRDSAWTWHDEIERGIKMFFLIQNPEQ